jgi:hypothetical protein
MQPIRTKDSSAHIAITFHARDGSRADTVKGGKSLRPELTMNLHHAGAGETCSFPAERSEDRAGLLTSGISLRQTGRDLRFSF